MTLVGVCLWGELLELSGDFLGRPVLAQMVAHEFEQRAFTVQLGPRAGMDATPVTALLSVLGDVASATAIAPAFTAGGALAALWGFGDGTEALPLLQPRAIPWRSLSLNCS